MKNKVASESVIKNVGAFARWHFSIIEMDKVEDNHLWCIDNDAIVVLYQQPDLLRQAI